MWNSQYTILPTVYPFLKILLKSHHLWVLLYSHSPEMASKKKKKKQNKKKSKSVLIEHKS